MSGELVRVESLTITFLVDNSIEWMTKLPPGFSHEVHQHLRDQVPPIDPLTGVPILDFENYCCGAHGLSALIETTHPTTGQVHRTLFDTGPESRSIVRNLAALAVDPATVDRIVLSHWHSDHSGGLLAFLGQRASVAARTPCIADLHPARPIARGIAPPPVGKVIARLAEDPSFAQITAVGGVVEKHAEGHVVAGGTVWVSGEIPRVTPWEQGLIGSVRWVEDEFAAAKGKWIPDEDIMDERYTAVDVLGKGLVIFSACSHAGIINVVKDAVATFKRPIYMVIGGLHLAGPELFDRIAPTVDFLARGLVPAPTYVLPMHCTGFVAKCALQTALGEGCVPAGAGTKVIVATAEEEKAADGRLFSGWN